MASGRNSKENIDHMHTRMHTDTNNHYVLNMSVNCAVWREILAGIYSGRLLKLLHLVVGNSGRLLSKPSINPPK